MYLINRKSQEIGKIPNNQNLIKSVSFKENCINIYLFCYSMFMFCVSIRFWFLVIIFKQIMRQKPVSIHFCIFLNCMKACKWDKDQSLLFIGLVVEMLCLSYSGKSILWFCFLRGVSSYMLVCRHFPYTEWKMQHKRYIRN